MNDEHDIFKGFALQFIQYDEIHTTSGCAGYILAGLLRLNTLNCIRSRTTLRHNISRYKKIEFIEYEYIVGMIGSSHEAL